MRHLERQHQLRFGVPPGGGYPATRGEKISFKQLRATDLSPIRYLKVAEADQKEVKADEIVKGYEIEKAVGEIGGENFEKGRIEAMHSVEIIEFLEQAQINPRFFYKPFLEAQKRREES